MYKLRQISSFDKKLEGNNGS